MHRYFAAASSRAPNRLPVMPRKEPESVKQLSAGEPTAWAELVENWSPCLYNYLIHNEVSEVDVAKLMREIFAELVQAFVGALQVANLAVLIFAITYHHVLHYRQQHRDTLGKKQLPASASDPKDNAKARAFFYAFQQFSPDVQQILLLYYLYGISLPEIAQIAGRSERSLAKTLYHAKMYLQ